GNLDLRRLLVQAAHDVLGRFGPDSALRRWGLKLALGGKRAKKRALVAVARKLAVILHCMWRTGQSYQPFPQPTATVGAAQSGKRLFTASVFRNRKTNRKTMIYPDS